LGYGYFIYKKEDIDMNRYTVKLLTNLLSEIKQFKKYENVEAICALLNNEIPTSKCVSVTINDSGKASSFYGIVVYPDLDGNREWGTPKQYTIEIQRQAIDLFSSSELAALIIHDISHNVLTSTVGERLKLALLKACRITSSKVVTTGFNLDRKMVDLAALDIANRTFKTPLVPGTEMYEPDRLLIDLGIEEDFNDALTKMASIDYLNLSMADNETIADANMGLHLVKMVREKARKVTRAYDELMFYLQAQYDTKVFNAFPRLDLMVKEDRFGAEVLEEEDLRPFEHRLLDETATTKLRKQTDSLASTILEAADSGSQFGNKRISYSALQRELDILNFKIDGLASNYERLAVLDRIYDNIFALEKYLDKNPKDTIVWDYLKKFVAMTGILKDTKIAKRKYGVFVEVPDGYEG
jgi:hypothetical protein